jgi:glutamyl-tRNA reductase
MTRSADGEGTSRDHLILVGASHRTASLEVLERLTLSPSGARRILADVAGREPIREVVALATCNRTELYLVATDRGEAETTALAALSRVAGVRPAVLLGRVRSVHGPNAVRHLFRVTAGLESMAVGETEVQGQVKRAYERALLEGVTGPITNRLFRGALEAGKRARTHTDPSGPRVSIASVAVGLAARRLGDLEGRRTLVVGTGENGELAGRALAEHGVRTVFVAGRRHERALALARRCGGRAVASESLRTELIEADLVISCTSSPHRILARDDLAPMVQRRGGRLLVVVDIAMPRDVDPAVRDLPHVALFDMDDMRAEVADGARPDASALVASLIEREVERFQEWLVSRSVVPAISALRERGQAAAEEVLREHAAGWESPSPEDRERVRMVAHAVVNRLLHEPTARLKRSSGSPASTVHVQALAELFGSNGEPPAGA